MGHGCIPLFLLLKRNTSSNQMINFAGLSVIRPSSFTSFQKNTL